MHNFINFINFAKHEMLKIGIIPSHIVTEMENKFDPG